MKPIITFQRSRKPRYAPGALLSLLLLLPSSAHASIFKGEALDKVANVLTWVVLIVAPIVAIGIFLLIHILPEKIAEKKQHPQAKAIQCLCLLSLVFGGLLWPLAWLWAYTKPVMHKLAYGTDKEAHDTGTETQEARENAELRQRVVELESRLADKSASEGEKG